MQTRNNHGSSWNEDATEFVCNGLWARNPVEQSERQDACYGRIPEREHVGIARDDTKTRGGSGKAQHRIKRPGPAHGNGDLPFGPGCNKFDFSDQLRILLNGNHLIKRGETSYVIRNSPDPCPNVNHTKGSSVPFDALNCPDGQGGKSRII
jgi:hypothetical protein